MQLHAAALNAIQCQIHMCSAISLVVQGRDSGRFKIFLMKILDVLLKIPCALCPFSCLDGPCIFV